MCCTCVPLMYYCNNSTSDVCICMHFKIGSVFIWRCEWPSPDTQKQYYIRYLDKKGYFLAIQSIYSISKSFLQPPNFNIFGYIFRKRDLSVNFNQLPQYKTNSALTGRKIKIRQRNWTNDKCNWADKKRRDKLRNSNCDYSDTLKYLHAVP